MSAAVEAASRPQTDEVTDGAAPVAAATSGRGYVVGAVALLTIVAILNSADRMVISVLAQPIKVDLHLTDTQLGLAIGIVFALPYTVLGVPISWAADRFSRPRVLALCMVFWSLMTALTGSATSFLSLALPRMGTATGEAGCTPTAHSLITDYVRPERRPLALSVFGSGSALGGMTGLMVGGVLASRIGWRSTFVALGLPGVLLALVVALVLRETRGAGRSGTVRVPRDATFWRSAIVMLKHPTFQLLVAVALVGSMASVGALTWVTPFAMRKFGLPIKTVGVFFGLISGICSVAGMLFGGLITSRAGKKMRTWRSALCVALGACFIAASFVVGDYRLALVFVAVGSFLQSTWYAPCFSGAQTVAPPEGRAQASALVVLAGGIGQGIGPSIVGWLSDALRPAFGESCLQWAMVGMALCGTLTGLALFLTDRSLKASPTASAESAG